MQWHKRDRLPAGGSFYCKEKRKTWRRTTYLKNKEKEIQAVVRWRRKNPDKVYLQGVRKNIKTKRRRLESKHSP
jgi:hypothetical protein